MNKKHIISLSLLALLFTACTPKSEWQLVWSDEFDADTLNTGYWNVEDNARGGGNAELQYYSPRNITFEAHPQTGDRCLVLNAQREEYRFTHPDGREGIRPCTSARLNTQDKVTVCYGRVEARIAFPYTADGLWPAFWMLGNNLATDLGNNDDIDTRLAELEEQGRVVWPKCGEIDIVEMGHKDGIAAGTQDRFFNGACHWGEAFNDGAYPNVGRFNTADYPLQGDFHLFTLDWTEDSIAMYLDLDKHPEAEPYFTLSLRGKEINEPGHYFNHPFYMVLNLSVGGYFTGMPSHQKYPQVITPACLAYQPVTALPEDGTPAKMYVDYIRVYRPLRSK